ncbi:DNA repair protein RecO [Halomonas shantousis]
MTPQPAYLLHKRPYRETSALVDLLTLEHGRVRAVAQGVQRSGSKSRARLQPFSPLHVTWTGESDLKRLRLMESSGGVSLLAGEGLLCGFYVNELLTRTLPLEFPVREVFGIYALTLEALTLPQHRAPALRRMEITLLEALDAAPVFSDEHDAPLEPAGSYVYRPETRHFRRAGPDERGTDGRSLRLLARGDWEAPGLAGLAKQLTRVAMAPLLGHAPLRSRELMYRLAAQRQRISRTE